MTTGRSPPRRIIDTVWTYRFLAMLVIGQFVLIILIFAPSETICFGCGSSQPPPGSSGPEVRAIEEQMIDAVTAGVYITIAVIAAGAWAQFTIRRFNAKWENERENESSG